MQIGSITLPVMPTPTPPLPSAEGIRPPGNGGIVPPWLVDPIRILPWPWPEDGEDASVSASWSNN
jgi:hypothetical protein